jgi:FkbM family methyltransferase
MQIINELKLVNITHRGCAVHEIEQLNLFERLICQIDSQAPTMVELGSCDAYYSIIFNKFFKDRDVTNYCLEINEEFFEIGLQNCNNNNCKNVVSIKAGIGDINESTPHVVYNKANVNQITFSQLVNEYQINYIDILHMDIQGTEISVLEDIVNNKLYKNINYMFVSTHHQDNKFPATHHVCKKIIEQCNVEYFYDDEYSGGIGDGLLVFKFLPNEK